jgi:hypothetical protein
MLAGVATLATISPVLAQTRGPAPGAADRPGPAETKHMQDTLRVGSLSLALSRIAVQ